MFYNTLTVICSFWFIVVSADDTCIQPPKGQTALMARFIIHESDWTAVATISTLEKLASYPFVNIKSLSDGPISEATGVPYVYLTDLDLTGKDLQKDNRASLLTTLAQSDYCKCKNYDPQDPRCARLILTGRIVKVERSSPEHSFAKTALLTRHPAMRYWPEDHGFYIAKLEIEDVAVLDNFGDVKYVSPEEYFNVTLDTSNVGNEKSSTYLLRSMSRR